MNGDPLMLAVIDDLGSWLWRANWQAAVLAVLIAIVLLCVGRRLAPTWRFALWILVVVRLCLPIVPASPLSVFNLWPEVSEQPRVIAPAEEIADWSGLRVSTQYGPLPTDVSPDRSGRGMVGVAPATRGSTTNWGAIAIILWLAAVAALTTFVLVSHLRFAFRVRRGSEAVVDPTILALVERSCREMGLCRPIEVRHSPEIGSPALFGAWRPLILLPKEMLGLDRDLLRFVVLHELAHVKRRDVHINWLLTAVAVVHWFNPLVHFVVSRCRQERELICDQMVLDIVGHGQRRAYGRALVDLFEHLVGEPCPALAVGFFGRRSLISRRIQMISTSRPSRHRGTIVAAVFFTALAAATLTDGRVTPPSQDTAAETASTPPAGPGQDASVPGKTVLMTYDLRDLVESTMRMGAITTRSPLVASLLASESRYRVSEGDTLPLIASLLLGDPTEAPRIAEHNHLAGTESLKVGQILVIPGLAAEDPAESSEESLHSAAASDLISLIAQRLQSGAGDTRVESISHDPRSNRVQVVASRQDHARIASLLNELREPREQILIETRFLTGLADVVAEGGAAVEMPPGQIPRGVGVISLTADAIELITKATDGEGGVSVLASPNLLVVDGQNAWIAMTSSSEVAVPNADPTGKHVSLTVAEGITVALQATVSEDRRFVTLRVQPSTMSLDLTAERPIERRIDVDVTLTVPDGGAALLQLRDAPLTLLEARAVVDPRTGETRQVVTRGAADVPSKSIYILICPRLILNMEKDAAPERDQPGR